MMQLQEAQAQKLLESLSDVSSRLPDRTLFGLALGGLKIRLTRSVVTLGSVVLAIAYLGYSSTYIALTRALAQAGNEDVDALLRLAKINIEATRTGNPLDRWLVIMALLACTVGIANAMLMSVTERFREIGTMKCLGAEDGTVVKLFLIESSLVGLAGSLIGVVLGLLISLVVALAQFGAYTFTYMPVGPVFVSIGLSVAAGVVLCLIGAGYPALVAARMRPVEALRVEE